MLDNDCDMTFSNVVMCKNGRPVEVRAFKDIPAFDNESLLRYHLMHHLTGTPTYMFKAEKLREIGGFDNALCGQEFILMLKAIEGDLKIRYLNVNHVLATISAAGGISFSSPETLYHLRNYAVLLIFAIVGSTPIVKKLATKFSESKVLGKVSNVIEPIMLVVLLAVITAFLVDSSSNPFLYFRF
jgi:hypothetical protein